MKSTIQISELIDSISMNVDPFEPVFLDQLTPDSQMMRFDLKYVFASRVIPDLIREVPEKYRILEINNKRILKYKTYYFDTPRFSMYTDHHNGKGERYKIRVREYLDTKDRFLEIKKKTNKGLMVKSRIQINKNESFNKGARKLISNTTPYSPDELIKTMETSFSRLTLVSKQNEERITIDFGLQLTLGGKVINLPHLGIAEIKKSDQHVKSPFELVLNCFSIKPINFSKYCTGLAMLEKRVKYNVFKRKILLINRLEHESYIPTVY